MVALVAFRPFAWPVPGSSSNPFFFLIFRGRGGLVVYFLCYIELQLSSHLVGTLGSRSQFTYICAGLSPPLNVESNRS